MSFLNNAQKKSTILITGGSSGIGLALTDFLLNIGHDVIIVDNNQSKLDTAKSKNPKLVTICIDLASESDRKALKQRIVSEHSDVNVLINAASLNLNPPALHQATTDNAWLLHERELEVNLMAPVHLTTLLLPHLMQQSRALVVNVSSIFAFFPIASHPAFCAAKAGLHSFTLSLRHQMRDSAVRVVELVPPLVESPAQAPEFKGKGMDAEEFVRKAMKQLLHRDEPDEISYDSDHILRASRDELDALFQQWNCGVSSSCKDKLTDTVQL
jgi:uncharacterized oxidoreductase